MAVTSVLQVLWLNSKLSAQPGPQVSLTDAEIRDIVAYLKTL